MGVQMRTLTEIESDYKSKNEQILQAEDDFNKLITSSTLKLDELIELAKKVEEIIKKIQELKSELDQFQLTQTCFSYLSGKKVAIINVSAGIGTALSNSSSAVAAAIDNTVGKWVAFAVGSAALWVIYFSNSYYAKKNFDSGKSHQKVKEEISKSIKKTERQGQLLKTSVNCFHQLAHQKQQAEVKVTIDKNAHVDMKLNQELATFVKAYRRLKNHSYNVIPTVMKASLPEDDPINKQFQKVESCGKILCNTQQTLPVQYLKSSSTTPSLSSWQAEEGPKQEIKEEIESVEQLKDQYTQAWDVLNFELMKRFGAESNIEEFDTSNGIHLTSRNAVPLTMLKVEEKKEKKLEKRDSQVSITIL